MRERYSYTITRPGQETTEPMTAEQAARELGMTSRNVRRAARVARPLADGTIVNRVDAVESLDDLAAEGERSDETVRVRKDAVVYLHTWDEGMVLETERWITRWSSPFSIHDTGEHLEITGTTLEADDE